MQNFIAKFQNKVKCFSWAFASEPETHWRRDAQTLTGILKKHLNEFEDPEFLWEWTWGMERERALGQKIGSKNFQRSGKERHSPPLDFCRLRCFTGPLETALFSRSTSVYWINCSCSAMRLLVASRSSRGPVSEMKLQQYLKVLAVSCGFFERLARKYLQFWAFLRKFDFESTFGWPFRGPFWVYNQNSFRLKPHNILRSSLVSLTFNRNTSDQFRGNKLLPPPSWKSSRKIFDWVHSDIVPRTLPVLKSRPQRFQSLAEFDRRSNAERFSRFGKS